MMMMDKSPWIKINKGDRRPEGRVLVVYEWEQKEIINDEKIVYFGVTGAYWNAKRQFWVADHGKPIRNVTYWMPLPKAPWEYDG